MQNSMRAISRRLQRLEKRLGLAVEDREARDAGAARLEAARLRLAAARPRCEFPPRSPERLAGLRGMSIVRILNAARDRLALARRSELREETAS
jgi:hypothetical protein